MAFDTQIYNTAISDGMPPALALLIVAQSKHESNDYTSPVFLSCNNSFGYGQTGNPCAGHSQYEAYNSVIDSTHELTAWIKRRLDEGNFPDLDTITTPEQYAQLLKDNGYYSDSVENYLAGLRNWFTSNIGTVAGVTGVGLVIGIGIFLLLFRKELHIYKKQKITSRPSPWKSVYSKQKF